MSGPPSVDPHHHLVSMHHNSPHSVPPNSTGPSSVDPRLTTHHSNPASIDHQHQHRSIPSSPLSEVLAEAAAAETVDVGATSSAPVTAAPPISVAAASSSVGELFENPSASLMIDSAIINPGLSSETDVTFTTSHAPSPPPPPAAEPQRQKIPDSTAATAAAVGQTSSSSSATTNFLSELDSVLSDAADEFPFHSALNADSMQLKTPEKLLHSIPPSSMTLKKLELVDTAAAVAARTDGQQPIDESAASAASTSSSNTTATTRTNFLGALTPSLPTSEAVAVSAPPPPPPPPPFHDPELSNHGGGDSLSCLFDEIPAAEKKEDNNSKQEMSNKEIHSMSKNSS